MGKVLHPSASTTPATRRKIQNSKESLKKLAKRYGIAVNTVMKWKKRDFVHDAPRGVNRRHSTVLSRQEEALIVTFRKTYPSSYRRLFILPAKNHTKTESL